MLGTFMFCHRPLGANQVIKLRKPDLFGTRLRPADDAHGFRLEVPHRILPRSISWWAEQRVTEEWFDGAEGERLAGQIIPKLNRTGGKKRTVQDAVAEIEHHGHPDDFLADVVTGNRFKDGKGVPGYINQMPAPTKLALEMALHEEQERHALEGELWRLKRAWEAAEEIAAISDSLLLPTGTEDFIEKHRGGGDRRVSERTR